MSYSIEFTPQAIREIKKLSRNVQISLREEIDRLAENPYPSGIKKLKGNSDYFRLRVGDYRVIYAIENKQLIVLVVNVGHRKEVYRRL